VGVGDAQERGFAVDAEGRFAFRAGFAFALRGRPGRVFARAPGYAQASLQASVPGRLTIRLTRGRSVRGRVEDEVGTPVEGAWVSAQRWPGVGGPSEAAAATDEHGRFVLEGLPDDLPFVVATHGARLGVGRILAGSGETEVVVLDRRFTRLEIQVRTADGGPIPEAWLRWRQGAPDALQSSEEALLLTTDWIRPAGSAAALSTLLLVRPAATHVRLEVPGYLPLCVKVPEPQDVLETVQAQGVLEPDPATGGLRVDLLGLPAAPTEPLHAFLYLEGSDVLLDVAEPVVPAGERSLLVRGLAPEYAYTLEVVGPAWIGRVEGLRVRAGAETAARLALERAASLELVVRDAPAGGVAFHLRRPGGAEGFEVPVAGERVARGGGATAAGLRHTSDFFAPPDGQGGAFRRIEGLRPGVYDLVGADLPPGQTVVLRAGQSVRHVVPRR
jgi:hypothetical protein